MASLLLAETAGPVRILILNRPAVMNALNTELRDALADALDTAAAEAAVRVVILTGAGERAFCAGQDLNETGALKAEDEAAAEDWQHSWGRFYRAFLNCNKPIIAAVNGVSAGGGFVIASLADIRVMADGARFIMSEVNIGLPSIFGSYFLSTQIFLSRTAEFVLSGRDMSAEEAQRIGFAHAVVPPGEVMAKARAYADEFVEKAPTPLRLTVTRIREVAKREFEEVSEALMRYQKEAVATGEPQRVMAEFLAARERRKAAG